MSALSTASSTFDDISLGLEDDWVAVKESPFSETDNYSLTAVAVDLNSSRTVFHVTLLSLREDRAEERLWSDCFTINKIQRRHYELCLVCSELKNHRPALPKEPQGIWSSIQWISLSPNHCKNLEEYIKKAFQLCGWKVFSNVFFGDKAFLEDYTISTLQLKRSKYEKEVGHAEENFQKYLLAKDHLKDAEALMNWHEHLNDVLGQVQQAEKRLLKFDCEPYEELRDIAQKERSESAAQLNEQSLTESSFEDTSQTFTQWEEQYVESITKIITFRSAYFATSLSRLQEIMQDVVDDTPKLIENGHKNICAKLDEIKKEVLTAEMHLLHCDYQSKVLERDELRQDAVSVEEDSAMANTLSEKEVAFYKKQHEILSTKYEIQEKKECIIRLDMKKSKEINQNQDEKELQKLDQSFAKVARKKALLRNNITACEKEIHKMTKKDVEQREQFVAHHAVQMKMDRRREEDMVKRNERLEERQKTLLRLKEYKKKHVKPKEARPPRYQPPSTRRGAEKNVKKASQKTSNKASGIASGASKTPEAQVASGTLTRTSSSDADDVSVPRETTTIHTSTTTIPEGTTTIPKGTTTIPESTTTISGSATTIPTSTTTIPESSTTIPTSTTQVPESTNTSPSVPPPPPPPPPPPAPLAPLKMPTRGAHAQQNGGNGAAARCLTSPVNEPGSLSQETISLDVLLLTRDRLKRQASTDVLKPAAEKGFPSGSELTRALQSVKLRRVASEEKAKPSDLSRDGAECLRKALERMNKVTRFSDNELSDDDADDWSD